MPNLSLDILLGKSMFSFCNFLFAIIFDVSLLDCPNNGLFLVEKVPLVSDHVSEVQLYHLGQYDK